MANININDKMTIEALQYALRKVVDDMKEAKEQNAVLQERNTELVKENRYYKKCTEQLFNEGQITISSDDYL